MLQIHYEFKLKLSVIFRKQMLSSLSVFLIHYKNKQVKDESDGIA